MAEDGDDKTETATAKHAGEARDSGNVAISREATVFAGLLAVVMMLTYRMPGVMRQTLPDLRTFIARANDPQLMGPAGFHLAAHAMLGLIMPALVMGIVAGAAAVLLQTNFLFHLGAFTPKVSRVNPMAGIKRLFGSNGLIEVVKSLGKLGLSTLAVWLAVRGELAALILMPWRDTHSLLPVIGKVAFKIMFAGLGVQAVIAGIDIGWVRYRHAKNLRMSKQDVRDEFKESEGNPQIKGRIRRIRLIRARKRMMAKVPTATVVITNPTHYAVALVYDRATNPAPKIVAKGVDHVAAKIREIAQANNVPLIANPPLARALHRLDLGAEIPAEHYKAVAEIIAFIWKLRRPASRL